MLEYIILGVAAVVSGAIVINKIRKKGKQVNRELAKNYYFDVWDSKNGPRFRLKKVDDNDIVLHGEAYSSVYALKDTLKLLAKATGIKVTGIVEIDSTVDEKLTKNYYFEIWNSKNGPRFRLKHDNGEILLHSEAYSSRDVLNGFLNPLVEGTGVEVHEEVLDVVQAANADKIADAKIADAKIAED